MPHTLAVTAFRLCLLGASLAVTTAYAGTWTPMPPFDGPRAQHTATLLPDGRVWMVGGISGETSSGGNLTALASTRLFDPATRTWADGPELPIARYGHTATQLPDGTVLLAGGRASDGGPLTTERAAATYDPATDILTATGPMQQRRSHHTATLMQDGRVLVVGGQGTVGQAALDSVEIYDPISRTWTAARAMPAPERIGHTATLLPDGRVLVAGGRGNDEIPTRSVITYTPATNQWTHHDVPHLPPEAPSHAGHTATLLPDGRVLMAGGGFIGSYGEGGTQLFDPTSNTWTPGPHLGGHFGYSTATLLPDATVLIAGGTTITPDAHTSTIAVTPGDITVTSQPDMSTARVSHTATVLPGGHVLVLGGVTGSRFTPTHTTELYTHGDIRPHFVPALSQCVLLLLTGLMLVAPCIAPHAQGRRDALGNTCLHQTSIRVSATRLPCCLSIFPMKYNDLS